MVPKGKTFADAPALIYVQVFYHADKQQSLANFAGVSNGRWRAAVKDAKVSELPTIGRANGKPGYLALRLRKSEQDATGLRDRRVRHRFRQGRQ